MELGAWYTVTNAVDTGIGNERNYRDKGVFVSIPFEALLPADSRVVTGFSIAPWTRDPGQMVNSPVDLYQMLEKPLMLDMHKYDGLVRLGDVEDDYNLPYLGSPMWDRPFENLGRMTVQDWGRGAGALGDSGAWQYALIGTGAVLGSDAFFPSNHATVMWAAVTPFAREYDAPWLYGLAALTNAGRIASREHWLSDTVASSLLGFAIGDFFWQERRKPDDRSPRSEERREG